MKKLLIVFVLFGFTLPAMGESSMRIVSAKIGNVSDGIVDVRDLQEVSEDQKTVTIPLINFINLIKIGEEYTKVSNKKKVKTIVTQEDDYTIMITLIVAQNLEFSDDLIYQSPMKFKQKIKKIKVIDAGNTFIDFDVEKKVVFKDNSFIKKIKYYCYGFLSGAVVMIMILAF